jgi:uncharacterized RDD family membrane protein YckC
MIADSLLLMVVVLPLGIYLRNSAVQAVVVALFCAAFLILYDVVCLKKWGKTLGKHLVGLSVRTVDLKPLAWKHSILRHSFDIFFQIIGLVSTLYVVSKVPPEYYGWSVLEQANAEKLLLGDWNNVSSHLATLWMLSEVLILLTNEKRRSLHDFIAGTVVIEGS